MQKIISIEGLIGAGKSTLLRQVSSRFPPKTNVVLEPLADFCNYKGFNPLQLTYENPKENAPMCQLHIISCLERQYREQPPDAALWVTERSLFSPLIFTRALEAAGFLSPFTACKLVERAEENIAVVTPNHPLGADKLFYIDCPVEVCMQRIRQRQRNEEEGLCHAWDYMYRLEDLYKKHVDRFGEEKGTASVYVVNHNSSHLEEGLMNFVYDN